MTTALKNDRPVVSQPRPAVRPPAPRAFRFKFNIHHLAPSGRVRGKELAVFTRQLATTLSAGLLLTEALETIAEDMANLYFRGVLFSINEEIQGGLGFSQALTKHPRIFPVTFIAIIRSGEASGTLHRTLADLAKYLENTERLKQKVKSALRYPMFIVGFAIFVVLVMVLFLIPKFSVMYSNAGAQLPLLTRVVMAVSNFCIYKFPYFVGAAAALGFAFWYSLRYPRTRYLLDAFSLKLPLVGRAVIHKALLARFTRTFSVLLSGGVGLSQSLEITAQVVNNRPMAEAIDRVRQRVVGGASIADEIRSQPIFPHLVAKMASVGEKSGRLDDMLKRTSTC